ncbi:hypothetical protein N7474_009355 [Penicillium riverlandense]|uniref:uncharacterized protein n=1 Tax=Penicillium riverlandense TaxID=1903569 RepID=UPI002547DC20|nr:uncharacterized protein N7474_009355 [Penicillium riverlandense]KAJ5808086.1 hypothetical protein N7474_009355 [Penicillium riverlandense]
MLLAPPTTSQSSDRSQPAPVTNFTGGDNAMGMWPPYLPYYPGQNAHPSATGYGPYHPWPMPPYGPIGHPSYGPHYLPPAHAPAYANPYHRPHADYPRLYIPPPLRPVAPDERYALRNDPRAGVTSTTQQSRPPMGFVPRTENLPFLRPASLSPQHPTQVPSNPLQWRAQVNAQTPTRSQGQRSTSSTRATRLPRSQTTNLTSTASGNRVNNHRRQRSTAHAPRAVSSEPAQRPASSTQDRHAPICGGFSVNPNAPVFHPAPVKETAQSSRSAEQETTVTPTRPSAVDPSQPQAAPARTTAHTQGQTLDQVLPAPVVSHSVPSQNHPTPAWATTTAQVRPTSPTIRTPAQANLLSSGTTSHPKYSLLLLRASTSTPVQVTPGRPTTPIPIPHTPAKRATIFEDSPIMAPNKATLAANAESKRYHSILEAPDLADNDEGPLKEPERYDAVSRAQNNARLQRHRIQMLHLDAAVKGSSESGYIPGSVHISHRSDEEIARRMAAEKCNPTQASNEVPQNPQPAALHAARSLYSHVAAGPGFTQPKPMPVGASFYPNAPATTQPAPSAPPGLFRPPSPCPRHQPQGLSDESSLLPVYDFKASMERGQFRQYPPTGWNLHIRTQCRPDQVVEAIEQGIKQELDNLADWRDGGLDAVSVVKRACGNLRWYADHGNSNFQGGQAAKERRNDPSAGGQTTFAPEAQFDTSSFQGRRIFLNNATLVPYMGPPCIGDAPPSNNTSSANVAPPRNDPSSSSAATPPASQDAFIWPAWCDKARKENMDSRSLDLLWDLQHPRAGPAEHPAFTRPVRSPPRRPMSQLGIDVPPPDTHTATMIPLRPLNLQPPIGTPYPASSQSAPLAQPSLDSSMYPPTNLGTHPPNDPHFMHPPGLAPMQPPQRPMDTSYMYPRAKPPLASSTSGISSNTGSALTQPTEPTQMSFVVNPWGPGTALPPPTPMNRTTAPMRGSVIDRHNALVQLGSQDPGGSPSPNERRQHKHNMLDLFVLKAPLMMTTLNDER